VLQLELVGILGKHLGVGSSDGCKALLVGDCRRFEGNSFSAWRRSWAIWTFWDWKDSGVRLATHERSNGKFNAGTYAFSTAWFVEEAFLSLASQIKVYVGEEHHARESRP